MKIEVEAEVCTVVEKQPGTFHVLVKSAMWVLGLTTASPPAEKTVVRVLGERPGEDAPIDVHNTVMANHKVGISPAMRNRYKYAELTESSWEPSPKTPGELWKERRFRKAPAPAVKLELPKRPPGRA